MVLLICVCVCVFVCVCRADFVHMGRHMAEDRIVQAGTSQLHKEQVLSSSNHSVPVISVLETMHDCYLP